MVNLFLWQAGAAAPSAGSLAGALVTLLAHADRHLLTSFLELCHLVWPVAEPISFDYPAQALPVAGEIRAPGQWRLLLLAQGPATPWDPNWVEGALQAAANSPEPCRVLTITQTLRHPTAPQEAALTWEQVDRWLEQQEGAHPPETRTGFLLSQFREFLPAAGIAYFAGFDRDDLSRSAQVLATLQRLAEQADQFFAHLEPILRGAWPNLREVRGARPEDLLAGYLYRDYTLPDWGEGAFLRGALHLGQQSLEIAFWLSATAQTDGPHARMAAAASEVLPRLAAVDELTIRLWRVGNEQQLSPAEAPAAAIDWSAYQIGFQVTRGFETLPHHGLPAWTAERASAILDALAPILPPPTPIH